MYFWELAGLDRDFHSAAPRSAQNYFPGAIIFCHGGIDRNHYLCADRLHDPEPHRNWPLLRPSENGWGLPNTIINVQNISSDPEIMTLSLAFIPFISSGFVLEIFSPEHYLIGLKFINYGSSLREKNSLTLGMRVWDRSFELPHFFINYVEQN